MRIAIVSPGDYPIPPIRGGSVEIYLNQLSRKLANTHSVTVFSRGTPGVRSIPRLNYIRLQPVGTKTFIDCVCDRMRTQKADVIQVDNRPVFAKRLRLAFPSTPVVLNLHSLTFLSPRNLPKSIARSALTSPSAIVVNSYYVKNSMTSSWPSLAGSIHVIHPGVDLAQFPYRNSVKGADIRKLERSRLKIADDQLVLLFAGRVLRQKGLHVVLTAFARLYQTNKNLRLWVVGGSQRATLPPYEHYVRRLARGLPVTFFGFVTPHQLARFYLAADIFLCPSQQSEAFGMVNLEAAATGLPAIGSNDWGIKESIKSGVSGMLVDNYSSSLAWARAIGQLSSNLALRRALSKSARKWAVNHSWTKAASRFSQLYENLN